MQTNKWWVGSMRLIMALILNGLFFHANCYGHEGRPVFIDLTQTQLGQFSLRWKIPPVIQNGHEPNIQLLGQNCQPVSANYSASLTGSKLYTCQNLSTDKLSIAIQYPNHNPVLSSLIQFTKLSGESYSLFNGPDILTIALPEKVSFLQLAKQYTEAGFAHILEGFDHLLFVLCLMQIAGGLKRILITVSGFTLAHSITLALASLDIINIRIDVVEVLIALSIVMLAVEMAKGVGQESKASLIWQFPATVASLFGLLHGLGFASALGDLGLPQAMKLPALAFFNLGVELGQVLFIILVFSFLVFIKKIFEAISSRKPTTSFSVNPLPTPNAQASNEVMTAQFPMSVIYIIGGISGFWFVERCIGIFT